MGGYVQSFGRHYVFFFGSRDCSKAYIAFCTGLHENPSIKLNVLDIILARIFNDASTAFFHLERSYNGPPGLGAHYHIHADRAKLNRKTRKILEQHCLDIQTHVDNFSLSSANVKVTLRARQFHLIVHRQLLTYCIFIPLPWPKIWGNL